MFTSKDKISNIFYFTSLVSWSESKRNRHQKLLKIYDDLGLKIIYGEFRRREKRCTRTECNKKTFVTYEEKQTDINIAIKLFELAYLNKFDTAIILSGDSDLVPAIKSVKVNFPDKKIGVLIPINRKADQLKKVSDFYYKIGEMQLNSSILNDPYILKNNERIYCPDNWKS